MEMFDPVQYVDERAGSTDDAFSWTSRAEISCYTVNQLLRDTDVMSMAHSLEVRVPLLDHVLVEHVVPLSGQFKRGKEPKWLLKQAVANQLPPQVRERTGKQGFTFPFDVWMRGDLRERCHSAVQALGESPWINGPAAQSIWESFEARRVHWSRVWALVTLAGWVA
jgi:asparagine synthase (glutamine-hydrolysing)